MSTTPAPVTKKISDRVTAAVKGQNDPEFTKAYADGLRASIETGEDRSRKIAVVILLLFAMFELLTRSAIAEVSIGPFRVTDLKLVQKGLPLILAYLYYELIAFRMMIKMQAETYSRIMLIIAKPFCDGDLDLLTATGTPFEIEEFFSRNVTGTGRVLLDNLTFPIRLCIVAAVPVFLGYAYWNCFRVFGMADPLVWSTLVLTALLVAQSAVLMWQHAKFL